MADQWLLRLCPRLSRKETDTFHTHRTPPPHPSPRLPLCPHMCEIKAIMTLHLTENAISLAKTFHLFEILVGTRCPRALVVVVVESPA